MLYDIIIYAINVTLPRCGKAWERTGDRRRRGVARVQLWTWPLCIVCARVATAHCYVRAYVRLRYLCVCAVRLMLAAVF